MLPLRFDTHSPGRGYYDRKIAEGKTKQEALRALKRRVSDTLWAAMVADARRVATTVNTRPGESNRGTTLSPSAVDLYPDTPALRPSHSRARPKATATADLHRTPTASSPTRKRRSA